MNRVLVVENEPAICDLCRMALNGDGLEVDTAANGKIAEEMIEANKYDALIIDFKMPVVDGKDLFRWLERAHPSLTKKVQFVSGDVMSEETDAFLQQVARPFLPKPFSLGELTGAVRKLLAQP